MVKHTAAFFAIVMQKAFNNNYHYHQMLKNLSYLQRFLIMQYTKPAEN